MLENNNDYDRSIKFLRKERESSRLKFQIITEEVQEVINSLVDDTNNLLVSIEKLKLFNLNEVVQLTEKVSFVKVLENEKEMHFVSYILEGGKYGIHKHDCEEITKVIKGHLIETQNGNSEYSQGEYVIHYPNTLHEHKANMDSEYYVVFKFKPYVKQTN